MLNRIEITRAIEIGAITITPFNLSQMNPNSYDVTLDTEFFLVKIINGEPVYYYFSVPFGNKVYIPIGGTLLGRTVERVGTFDYFIAEARAKSSTRRKTITICDDAGFGDIGYDAQWTVELSAHAPKKPEWRKFLERIHLLPYKEYRPYLIVGEPFAQMVFFSSGSPLPKHMQYSGQYTMNGDVSNMVPKKHRAARAVLKDLHYD